MDKLNNKLEYIEKLKNILVLLNKLQYYYDIKNFDDIVNSIENYNILSERLLSNLRSLKDKTSINSAIKNINFRLQNRQKELENLSDLKYQHPLF